MTLMAIKVGHAHDVDADGGVHGGGDGGGGDGGGGDGGDGDAFEDHKSCACRLLQILGTRLHIAQPTSCYMRRMRRRRSG